MDGRTRHLAMFNLAIDSKLRAAMSSPLSHFGSRTLHRAGYAVDRATVRQKKTGRPVKFDVTEQTRQAVDRHLGQDAHLASNWNTQQVKWGSASGRDP
jgi:hypothetical protein